MIRKIILILALFSAILIPTGSESADGWAPISMAGAPSLDSLKAAVALDGKLVALSVDMPMMVDVGAFYAPSSSAPTTLTLVSPNGSEKLSAGSLYEITWTSEGEIEYVNIEYSINNGATWIEIISNTINDGSYFWTVPCSRSPDSLVRITQTGGEASDTSNGMFSIEDTTPPAITLSVSPSILWPPNHKMVSVSSIVSASDNCDSGPPINLESITSNEAENNGEVGNTMDDIQDAEFGTADYNFSLRAERSGAGNGRIYTIVYSATDASGNKATANDTVVVPHNK